MYSTSSATQYCSKFLRVPSNCAMISAVTCLACGISTLCWTKTKTSPSRCCLYLKLQDCEQVPQVGRLYYGLRLYKKAIQFYQTSMESSGEHHVTFHNMGLCHYSLAQKQLALHHFSKALLLKNDYTKARAWQHKLLQE